MTAPTRDELISRTAAARHLGVHPNTIDRIAKAAGLRRFRVRGDHRVFYLRAEIEADIQPIKEITS